MQVGPGDIGKVYLPHHANSRFGDPPSGRTDVIDLEYRHVAAVPAALLEVAARGGAGLNRRHDLDEGFSCSEDRVLQSELADARIVEGIRPPERLLELSRDLLEIASHERYLAEPWKVAHGKSFAPMTRSGHGRHTGKEVLIWQIA